MKANQVTYPIATMCRTLGVSPSGYYAWTIVLPEFLEGWYNPHRRHSGAGNLSPMEYEKQHAVNA